MTIDRSGANWKGTEATDLDEFLVTYSAGGYDVDHTSHSRCGNCEGTTFMLRVDDETGYADRRCLGCNQLTLILDSEDQADDASPEECACPCGGEEFELAIGFALVDVESHNPASSEPDSNATREVKWVSVGARCIRDGTLGVYTDWKIDYAPTAHLFESA